MQMTHYVVATRLEWGVTLLRCTRSGSKEIGYDVLTDSSRCDSFPFLFPLRHVRDHDSQYREFHHAPGEGWGMEEGVDHGNGLGFISRKISFMRHVPREGQKYAAEENPDGVSCLRVENLGGAWVVKASRDSPELFWSLEYSSCIYVGETEKKREGGRGECSTVVNEASWKPRLVSQYLAICVEI